MFWIPPVVEGAVELAKHLLGGLGGQIRHPVQLGASPCEVATLVNRSQRHPSLAPSELSLRQRDVPHRSAGVAPPGQPLGLPGAWVQPVAAASVCVHVRNHTWSMGQWPAIQTIGRSSAPFG
jgi:hypothetical protein